MLALAAVLLVPVAIAWACNPQAYLTLDRTSYAPGDQVTVSGSFFRENTDVQLSLSPGGDLGTVRSDQNGAFVKKFALASDARPGGYTVTATAVTPNGTFQARTAFEVKQQSESPPASDPPASGNNPPAAGNAPQSGQAPANAQPDNAQQQDNAQPDDGATFSEPGVFNEPSVGRSRGGERDNPSSSQKRGSTDRGTAPAQSGAGSGDVISVAGRSVFGGSAAPAEQAGVSPTSKSRPVAGGGPKPKSPQSPSGSAPTERTAVGDLWSGFNGGRAPSLLPSAADSVPEGSGAGSQLGWGLGLLGLGLVGLLAGVGVAEARRRRALRG